MALKVKYKDEHGILHINMSPTTSASHTPLEKCDTVDTDITGPKFDTINNRFGQYNLFGGKYEDDSGGEPRSLFRSRYNSIEDELAHTPYAFSTDRTHRPTLDITIKRSTETSPSQDIEDDRFFNRPIDYDLFGPIDFQTSIKSDEETPAFTVTQLIHAQDRYYDLSSKQSLYESPKFSSVNNSPKTVKKVTKSDNKKVVEKSKSQTNLIRPKVSDKKGDKSEIRSVPVSARVRVSGLRADDAFTVLTETRVQPQETPVRSPVVPTSKRKKEKSFAIIADSPSRPTSPHSLPVDIRPRERVSPFRGHGFREETSRHTTPRTSAANSRAPSPRRRTSSLSRLDNMATATLPPPIPPLLSRPHSPRNFLKENIEEIREISELNREKHESEAEKKRKEEEEALLNEMAEFETANKNDAIRSVVCSRTTSRSNSPSKIRLRSRSNSPSTLAPTILQFENIPNENENYINADDGMPQVTHKSRVRSMSRSQPQSNDGSPNHSKIPKRQNSVSPSRNNKRESISRRPVENGLKNQRFISNSTSSIHETIRIGGQAHDKRNISKSTQFLNIAPAHIRGKPPVSPGRGGPPPTNKSISSKRLSPIIGTPSKSPVDDKPNSVNTATKPSLGARKPMKTANNTANIKANNSNATRLNTRQPNKPLSREPSPDKRKTAPKSSITRLANNSTKTKPVVRAVSTKAAQKPTQPKTESKKPINRTSSMKSLTRTPSTKNLNEKPPLNKKDSNKNLKATSTTKLNETGLKKDATKDDVRKSPKRDINKKEPVEKAVNAKTNQDKKEQKPSTTTESGTGSEEVLTQDNETQYDKVTNEKGELVILTRKNIVSMTTAAITSQPLEVVTKVTNQLPATLEKAREKGIFERHGSKDSLAPKDDDADVSKVKIDEEKLAKAKSNTEIKPIFEDNVKLKPLLPPYNNPQVERAKQKIDNILKSPEVSTETIIPVTSAGKVRELKNTFKNIADKTRNDIKEQKAETTNKFSELTDKATKQTDKTVAQIRSEATKIVDSIMTPIEEPTKMENSKDEPKKAIEPIVMVVNEKNKPSKNEVMEKMTETLVKGEPDVEVQSSNMSTPKHDKMEIRNKMAETSGSEKSQSNGGFPQSTSTTPKPPARIKKDQKDKSTNSSKATNEIDKSKTPNICSRIMGKCKTRCCPCCIKGEEEDEKETRDQTQEKKGVLHKLNCCKKNLTEERVQDLERAAGKAASIEFENEVKRKRKLRDILCCGRKRRVSDVSTMASRNIGNMADAPEVVGDTGCCGKRRPVERRDSILSDRPPNSCCNNRLFSWVKGACRRNQPEISASRRQSLFSKNKSLSPTLPPEDTRTKLDSSLVEHTSMMRGAIPVLPTVLAYFCLFCNIVVPGLGTILSGLFCLCFGIPRFGVHDGARHRIGSFLINLLVGCGQLFTVLFCLVGWGWSIWWGVIMVKTARKYKKLKAEAASEDGEAPPVTTNNHTRA